MSAAEAETRSSITRPLSGCRVAAVVLLGLLTSGGLGYSGLRHADSAVERAALVGLGAVLLVVTLAIWLGASGLVVDREARTITPWFRILFWRSERKSVRVEPGDRVVVEPVRIALAGGKAISTRSCHVLLVGKRRRSWVTSLPTRPGAVAMAERLAAFFELPVEQRD